MRTFKPHAKITIKYQITKVFGMRFLRVATADGECSVSIRVPDDRQTPTRIEFVTALHRLFIELKRGA